MHVLLRTGLADEAGDSVGAQRGTPDSQRPQAVHVLTARRQRQPTRFNNLLTRAVPAQNQVLRIPG